MDNEKLDERHDYKNYAYFIRAEITHFDFATALMAKLNEGLSDKVRMKVILSIHLPRLQDGYGFMSSKVFECCEFLEFINGSYDSADLKTLNSESKWAPPDFKKPEEFTFETWHTVDGNKYHWQLIKKTTVKGIKWLTAGHTSDGWTRCCAGYVDFNYETVDIEDISEGQIIEVDQKEKYPKFCLKTLTEHAKEVGT